MINDFLTFTTEKLRSYWKKLVLLQWNDINCFLSKLTVLVAKQRFFSSYLQYETHRRSLIKLLKYVKLPIGYWNCAHRHPIARGILEVCLWCGGIAVHCMKTCCSLHKWIYTETHLLSRDEKLQMFWDIQYFKFHPILWLFENVVYRYIKYI